MTGLNVGVELFPGPERPNAIIGRANESLESAVAGEEVIDHLVRKMAVFQTLWTDAFAAKHFQLLFEMTTKLSIFSSTVGGEFETTKRTNFLPEALGVLNTAA